MTDTSNRLIESAICEKHGAYDRTYIEFFGRRVGYSPCPDCETEKQNEHDQRVNAHREAELIRRSEVCAVNFARSIPPRFKDCDFTNYSKVNESAEQALKQCAGYARNFSQLSKTGAGLILCGVPGTGKTHLSISIGKHVSKTGMDTRYVNLSDLIREVRSAWSDRDISEEMILNKYFNYDLLIIDEIGVQNGTENERNIIFEVINGRYERVKSTIILSNLSEPEIESLISSRSVDRIKDGGGGTLVFNWGSYRGRRAA